MKEVKTNVPESKLSEKDRQEIEMFVNNSQGYCSRIYGGKIFCDADMDALRKEFKENNEAIKKIKQEWGVE